jgi:hypothetical protein
MFDLTKSKKNKNGNQFLILTIESYISLKLTYLFACMQSLLLLLFFVLQYLLDLIKKFFEKIEKKLKTFF